MGRWSSSAIQIAAPPAAGAAPLIGFHPQMLTAFGCNFSVEVATASAFVANRRSPTLRQSLQVWAHLDTGANPTSISTALATHLGLIQTGIATSQTAGGAQDSPTYAIDLLFLSPSTLAARIDLAVGSCNLPFNVAACQTTPVDPRNFGILIGRDVMAGWHITWDGPSASVIISD